MRAWRVEHGMTEPKSVQCKKLEHPERDSDGKTIYVNTHFEDEREAWEKLLCETQAAASLNCRAVEQARAELRKQEADLVESSLLLERVRDGWKRKGPPP